MAEISATTLPATAVVASPIRHFARRFGNFTAANWTCVIFIAVIGLTILLGPVLAPYSPTAFNSSHPLEPPSLEFLFGTDEFGRDVFSRVVIGARPTLLLALAAAGLGVLLGSTTGLIAGYIGGNLDEI